MLDNLCEDDPVLNSDQELHMIGDFHGSTNALWDLYGKEAESHDEARIQPLKEDMDGVLLFVSTDFLRTYNRLSCADTYLRRPVYFLPP